LKSWEKKIKMGTFSKNSSHLLQYLLSENFTLPEQSMTTGLRLNKKQNLK